MDRVRLALRSLAVSSMVACGDASAEASLDIDALPSLSVREDLRVGSVDDPKLGFSQIGGVQVAPTGEIYVLETQEREVRIFDSGGTRVRTIGRQGQGPGEFERPITMGLLHDTLWVLDLTNRRVSWFGPDGALLFASRMSERVPVDVGLPGQVNLIPSSPGPDGFLTAAISFAMLRGAPPLPDSFAVPIVRFDRTGAVADTAGWRIQRGSTARFVTLEGLAPFAVTTGLISPPFEYGDSLRVNWEVAPALSRGSLRVTRLRSAADTVYDRRLDYVPAPLLSAYADSIVASYGERFATRADRGAIERAVRDALSDMPAFHPPLATARVGSDGTIWLRRSDATNRAVAVDLATWILIEPDGRVRGSLDLPKTMNVMWSDERSAWVADRDAYDVPWLVRIAIGP